MKKPARIALFAAVACAALAGVSLFSPRRSRIPAPLLVPVVDHSVHASQEPKSLYRTIEYVTKFKRSPPEGFERWVEFAHSNNCSSEISKYQQIYSDLDYWFKKGSISSAVFDDVLQKGNMKLTGGETFFIKFHPENGSLHGYDAHGGDGPWGLDGIKRIWNPVGKFLQNASVKPFTVMVSSMDYPRFVLADGETTREGYSNSTDMFNRISYFRSRYDSPLPFNQEDYLTFFSGNKPLRRLHGYFQNDNTIYIKNIEAPIFSHCKLENYLDIAMPLFYQETMSNHLVTDPIPWKHKKNVVFWRGASTGGNPEVSKPWRQYHRPRLVEWAYNYGRKHPGRVFDAGVPDARIPNPGGLSVDIGFNKLHNADEGATRFVNETYGLKKSVTFDKILEFKYLIVVDGHTWPSRLQEYLQTNSVILYNGIFTDYFSWMLKPFIHYVPFQSDYSDLEERLQWLMDNDSEAEKISRNARNLMETVRTKNFMQCYTSLAMLEYSRLFKPEN
ncbi:F-actin-capping protein subunit alpha [Entophlyctis luteolus]|nr:F-actin-capping protein subunit alpha [Entophlyctis luteolus]